VTQSTAQTVKQVAQRYGVRDHAVLAWIHQGHLRAVDVSSNPGQGRATWRVTPDALIAFEAARQSRPPAKPTPRRRRRDPAIIEYF
jgi:hypothetical protein